MAEIECPYCGYDHDYDVTDGPHSEDDEAEFECPNCLKIFLARCTVSVDYHSDMVEKQVAHQAMKINRLKSWLAELDPEGDNGPLRLTYKSQLESAQHNLKHYLSLREGNNELQSGRSPSEAPGDGEQV